MNEQNKTPTIMEETRSLSAFASEASFESVQRMAKMLATSDLVPPSFKGNVANCVLALEVANRTGSSIMAVTQNLDIIHGRPSWRSTYIIAALNSCGRFSPLKFAVVVGEELEVPYQYWDGYGQNKTKKDGKVKVRNMTCKAYCYDRQGELVEGPEISMEMAVKEGWYTKADSKWKTMPDLMIRYRAAAFFGRLYAPDILFGMHSSDEIIDIDGDQIPTTPAGPAKSSGASSLNDKIRAKKNNPAPEAPAGTVVEAELVNDTPPSSGETKEFF